MNNQEVLAFFSKKIEPDNNLKKDRYWWFKLNKQIPIFYNFLTNEQKKIICDWYDETDKTGIGECAFPLIGMLIGLIGTNPASELTTSSMPASPVASGTSFSTSLTIQSGTPSRGSREKLRSDASKPEALT